MVFARLKKKLSKKKATEEVAAASTVIPTTLPKPIEYDKSDIFDKEDEVDSLVLLTKISVVQQSSSEDDSMSIGARYISLDDEGISDGEYSQPGIDALLRSSSTFSTDAEYSVYSADSMCTVNSDNSMCSVLSSDSESSASNSVVSDKSALNSVVSDRSALNSVVSDRSALNSVASDSWDEQCFPETEYKCCGVVF